jgi:hypothetical protein
VKEENTMMKKISAALTAAALIGGMVGIATTANAAPVEPSPAESETWNEQSIITTDGTAYAGKIAFDNVREGYENNGSTTTVPAGERFNFLKYTAISDIFYVAESHTRTARVTNTSDVAFTVSNISAELVDGGYAGDSETHHADADGTTVLTTPVDDLVVAAGETAFIQFETLDPVVSTVRTNAAGEVTGIGSVTRFNYTINGEDYWFSESAGFGSAQFNRFAVPNPQESTENLFPPCGLGGDGTGTADPELTIGLCAWFSVQSIQFDSSYYSPVVAPPEEENPDVPDEPVVVPVTVSGTVKDADGNPMSGYLVTLRDSAGVETHTDISDEDGFWSVSEVFPEHYSAYILVEGEWILIMSPEDFDVTDEDLVDKDFVLDRGVVVPPTEEPAPEPEPETPEEETPPVVIPEPTPTPDVPEKEVPPVVTPEPAPEGDTPNVEPPVVVTDPPTDVTPPVVETPEIEPAPEGTPATVPPVLASTGADIRVKLTLAMLLLLSGTIGFVVSRRKRPTFAAPTLLAWQSKGE